MKKSGILLMCCFLTTINHAQETNSEAKKKSKKKPNAAWELYLKTTQEYCPDAYYILSTVSKGDHYAKYGKDSKDDTTKVIYISTVVHEACHGLNYDIGNQVNLTEGFFVEPGKTIAVESSKVYNSYEMNAFIPDSLKKKLPRYEVYIGKKQAILSAQIHGIYGLLDEFTAYYHGTLAASSLKPWYEKTFGFTDTEPWVGNYLPRIGGEVTAFYEFRLYMAWYLDHSKKVYPEEYAKLMANQKLREAYTLIYDKYEKLSQQYETELFQLERLLNGKGFKVKVEAKYFQVYGEFSSGGTEHYLEKIVWMNRLLTPELDAVLKEFRAGT